MLTGFCICHALAQFRERLILGRKRLHPQLGAIIDEPFVIRLSIDMSTVTISPKFQVVIPLQVRQALGLVPGEKMRVISYAGRVELVPVKQMKSLRGMLKGMDTTIERDADRQ